VVACEKKVAQDSSGASMLMEAGYLGLVYGPKVNLTGIAMRKRLQFRGKDSSAYDYDTRDEDMRNDVNSECAVVPNLQAVSRSGRSLNWLGLALFALLMIFPLVVQCLPLGVRQYLAATVR
jgi:hypothetical protein